MRRIIILIFLFCSSACLCFAQQQIGLQNLKTPNAPGFQILDIAPSSIEKPTNPKEFALSVFNLSNNGTALPKNFAFEISPYWLFKPADENVYKYLNLDTKKGAVTQGNSTGGILRKLSISFASSFNDSTTGSLLKNTNYVSFGARTNIITINGNKRIGALTTAFKTMHTEIMKAGFKSGGGVSDPDSIEATLKNSRAYQQAVASLTIPPLFQLDGAFAVSEAFANNEYKKHRFNRSGIWLSATLSAAALSKTKNDNLSFIFLGRIIWDNALIDTTGNLLQRKNAYDFGGKADYSIGRFSISIEHLNRIYSGNNIHNSNRTVGTLQYKINDSFYITGTYGENFGTANNLITLLGINWGLGNSPLSAVNKK